MTELAKETAMELENKPIEERVSEAKRGRVQGENLPQPEARDTQWGGPQGQISMEEAERTPELIAVEINAIKRNVRCMMVSSAAEIGKRLTEAKRLVPYGRWGEYLAGLDYSDRTAQNLMRLAEEYDRAPAGLEDVSYTQAVLLLGVPREQREEFVESHDLDALSTRELQVEIKRLKDERDNMQVRMEELTDTVEAFRVTEKQEDTAVKEAEALRRELAETREDREAAETARQASEEKLRELKNRLTEAEERRRQAVEEAAGKSAGEIDSLKELLARKDAEYAAQLESAKAQIAEWQEKLRQAEETPAEVRTEIVRETPEEVQRELDALRARAASSLSESAARASFEAIRDAYKRLCDSLDDLEQDNGEIAGKCRAAFARGLSIMAEKVGGKA